MAFLHKGLVYFEGEFHTCWNVIDIPDGLQVFVFTEYNEQLTEDQAFTKV